MKQDLRTTDEIRQIGLAALQRALGIADAIRFIQLYYPGKGDFTRDRHKIVGRVTIEDVMAENKKIQSAKGPRKKRTKHKQS